MEDIINEHIMAEYNKFHPFAEHVYEGVHNLGSDELKILLTNDAPLATNAVRGDLASELSTGGGYTAGGATVVVDSSSQTDGIYKLVVEDVVFTAVDGPIGPFRYAVFYNDTPTSPEDPLIAWWDYGSSITLALGESFTIDFNAGTGVLTHA